MENSKTWKQKKRVGRRAGKPKREESDEGGIYRRGEPGASLSFLVVSFS
jgi:hypothetical protein